MSDIIGIVDDNGNLITSYAYDAWGKVLSVTGSNVELGNLNPFRYRSYYYDSDIEMYYLQSRYYDPEVCRFINSDDVNYLRLDEHIFFGPNLPLYKSQINFALEFDKNGDGGAYFNKYFNKLWDDVCTENLKI